MNSMGRQRRGGRRERGRERENLKGLQFMNAFLTSRKRDTAEG